MAEKDLQSLTEQRLRDVVAFCAGEESLEQAQSLILGLVTMIKDRQNAAGLKDLLKCLKKPVGPRGSQRLSEKVKTRGRTTYDGLAGPVRKKRLKGGRRSKSSQVVTAPTEANSDKSSLSTADTALAPSQCLESNEVAEATSDNESLPSTEIPLASTPSLESSQAVDSTSDKGQVASDSSQLLEPGEIPGSAYDFGPLPACPASHIEAHFDSNIASKAMVVMEAVLLDCQRLNSARVLISPQTAVITQSTELNGIQRSVKEVMDGRCEEIIAAITRDLSVDAAREIRARYIESFYWEVIGREADKLDPEKLPTPRGPLTEFSRTEKAAALKFLDQLGYGTGETNQMKYRKRWRRLHQMREAGIEKLLLYRTDALDDLFASSSSWSFTPMEVMLELEEAYRPHFLRIEAGAAIANVDGSTAKLWLKWPAIGERLDIPETSWGGARNDWMNAVEMEDCRCLFRRLETDVRNESGGLFKIFLTRENRKGSNGKKRKGGKGKPRDKSLFVSPVQKDGSLAVVPLIPVNEGDMLGVFGGQIRYSNFFDETHGSRGLGPDLFPDIWLDSSRVTGLLNLMGVTQCEEEANVRLEWDLYDIDAEDPEWRMVCCALRTIQPKEGMVRFVNEAQYLLHQDATSARRGFLK